jgi:hypothetical protein
MLSLRDFDPITTRAASMAVKDRGWFDWLALALAIAVCWYAIESQQPPTARPADAPVAEFSSGRAMLHVEAIAQAPHPTGSPEADRVRSVVVKTLEDLGLLPEVQAPRDKNSPLRKHVRRPVPPHGGAADDPGRPHPRRDPPSPGSAPCDGWARQLPCRAG